MTSKKYGVYIISYLKRIYGGHLTLKKDGILKIKIDDQKFWTNLHKKDGYNCYTFYNQNDGTFQLKDSDLIHGLFLIYSYSINKEIGLCSSYEDWTRFQFDAKRFSKYKEMYN